MFNRDLFSVSFRDRKPALLWTKQSPCLASCSLDHAHPIGCRMNSWILYKQRCKWRSTQSRSVSVMRYWWIAVCAVNSLVRTFTNTRGKFNVIIGIHWLQWLGCFSGTECNDPNIRSPSDVARDFGLVTRPTRPSYYSSNQPTSLLVLRPYVVLNVNYVAGPHYSCL